MDDGVIGAQAERSEVGCHRPVENPCLLQDVAEVDVSIKEGGVQLYRLAFREGGGRREKEGGRDIGRERERGERDVN